MIEHDPDNTPCGINRICSVTPAHRTRFFINWDNVHSDIPLLDALVRAYDGLFNPDYIADLLHRNIAKLNEYYARALRYAELAPPLHRRSEEELPSQWLARQPVHHDLLHQVLDVDLDHKTNTDTLHQLITSGLLATITVERYSRIHDRIPQSLDDLIEAGLITEPPHDVVTGGHLRYHALTEPDEQGRRYLVYSIGADEQDNAGQMHPVRRHRNAALFDLENGKGYDWVINAHD